MKKFIAASIILTSILFASCQKEQVHPLVIVPYDINVEYRVFGESGHLNIEYNTPDNGIVTTPQITVDRTNFTYSFNWKSGQPLAIKASNANPSGKEVKVEIYVNGVVFKTGLANTPNGIATAEGRY